MKIRNILFTITLLFCVMLPTGTNAQSAYQKKCTEIYVKYYSIFTYGRVQKLSTEESLAMAMYGAEVFAYGAIMEAVYKNPQSAKKTLKKLFNQTLREAFIRGNNYEFDFESSRGYFLVAARGTNCPDFDYDARMQILERMIIIYRTLLARYK